MGASGERGAQEDGADGTVNVKVGYCEFSVNTERWGSPFHFRTLLKES